MYRLTPQVPPGAHREAVDGRASPRYILGAGASTKLLEELFSENEFRESIRVGWVEPTAECKNFTPTFTVKDIDSYSSEPLLWQNTPRTMSAHLLFTSGSTGEPKGVVITHANVMHFVKWATRYFGMQESDKVSCHPPLHFDLATFDIFGAFAVGAQLHLVPAELNLLPNNMADFIRASELTQWFSVPSVLNYMAKFDVVKRTTSPALKRMLWCGEVFPTSALMYWMKHLPGVSFTNLYGPTEADHRQQLLHGSSVSGREYATDSDRDCVRRGGVAGTRSAISTPWRRAKSGICISGVLV